MSPIPIRTLGVFAVAACLAPLAAQSRIQGTNWFPIGPAPTTGGQTYGGGRVDVSGRSSAIAVNPSNANDVWLGTAAGGVWHTTDGGLTWLPMSDEEESLAIGSLALDGCTASGCASIYAGTGENGLRRDTYYGAGLLVGRTSSGEIPIFSWTQLGASLFRRASIFRVVLDPTTTAPNKTIYVALSSGVTASASESTLTAPSPPMGFGIYKSGDDGANWTKLNVAGSDNAKPSDLEMDPANHNTLYAAFLGKGIFKTTDGGANWCPLSPGIPLPGGCSTPTWSPNPTAGFDFIELALFRMNTSILYASLGYCSNPIEDSCGAAIYKSTDAGLTWNRMRVEDTTPGLAFQCPRAYSRYTHVLAVHPSISTTVFLGGTEMCKSIDSGATFTDLGSASVHPDHHDLAFADPSNPDLLYDSSDGGFAFSNNGGASWISRNTDLQITGFQSVASSPLTGKIIGGTQDNGTNLWMGSRTWSHIHDGDSGFTIMDLDDVMTMFDTNFGISPNRSTTGGGGFGGISSGITFSDTSAFYPPIVQDPSPPHPLYLGTNRLYRMSNKNATSPNWTAVSPDLSGGGFFPDINRGNNITAIAVAPSNANRIYIGYYAGQIFVTSGACTSTACWTSIGGSAKGLPDTIVTRIAVDPTNADVAYAAFSGFDSGPRVFKTTNGGSSWTPASGSGGTALPSQVPVNTLSIEASDAQRIWAGTDRGVFRSTDGGATWNRFSTGLPNAAVYEISIDETHGRVYAATHGRGMFVLTRPFLTNYEGWVDNQIWDIPVYGHGFLPNQSCNMQIIRQNGTTCASGSVDARGGTIQTDGTGQLVTSNGGFYSGSPVAFACFNGSCLGGATIASCNQPGNPITSVLATCGGLVGIDLVLGCPRQANPPSSLAGLSGLPGGPISSLKASRSAIASPGTLQLVPTVQSGDGTTRSLCSVSVPMQTGDEAADVLERARDAINASSACAANTVQAVLSGVTPPGPAQREDEGAGDPRLFLRAPGVTGGQLITSLRVGPGNGGGSCFTVDGLGVPVNNAVAVMRLKLETLAGGASGGSMIIEERSGVGTCSITVPTAAGQTAAQLASAITDAFQAPGIPGPHPRCPSRTNARDITVEGDSIISVLASGLVLCVRDAGVGFTLAPEELADTIPPTTVASASPAPNANGWNNSNVTVTLTATDNPGGSGVRDIQFSLSGAQTTAARTVAGSTATITVSAEGVTTLTFFATDNLGNREAPQQLTLRIDKTPPLVTGLPALSFCTLFPADGRMVNVGTAAASDALSGLDPASLNVTATSNEPQSGLFPGDQSPDIDISGLAVRLRAERSDTGSGRVYTINATALDRAGNVGTCQAVCRVPLK